MANLFSATCFGVSFCAVMMLMIVTHLKIKISSRIGYCDFLLHPAHCSPTRPSSRENMWLKNIIQAFLVSFLTHDCLQNSLSNRSNSFTQFCSWSCLAELWLGCCVLCFTAWGYSKKWFFKKRTLRTHCSVTLCRNHFPSAHAWISTAIVPCMCCIGVPTYRTCLAHVRHMISLARCPRSRLRRSSSHITCGVRACARREQGLTAHCLVGTWGGHSPRKMIVGKHFGQEKHVR
jgi:hypothetical protein